MPDAQRRTALRRLQLAHQDGTLSHRLYLSLLTNLVAEHAPRSIWAQWRRRPGGDTTP